MLSAGRALVLRRLGCPIASTSTSATRLDSGIAGSSFEQGRTTQSDHGHSRAAESSQSILREPRISKLACHDGIGTQTRWTRARRRPWASYRANSSPAVAQTPLSHRTVHSSAIASDFYKTLEIGKSASQKDIKAQFYKLSKKWHPDVNDGSNESKQKFQEVSEAYATLSNEQDRRAYDRKISSSGFGSPRASRTGGMRYASDNMERRQTATYAWDYQRRHAARQKRAASAGGNAQQRDHFEHGTSRSRSSPVGEQSSLFERFAERQRKREEATAARTGVSGINGLGAGYGSNSDKKRPGHVFVSQEEHEAQTSSGLVRFLQVSAVFSLIFIFTSTASGSSASSETRRRRL